MKLSKWLIILVLTTGILVISTSATLIRLASQSAFRSGVEFSLVIAASRVAIASLLLVPTWPKIKWKNLPPGANNLWSCSGSLPCGSFCSLDYFFILHFDRSFDYSCHN